MHFALRGLLRSRQHRVMLAFYLGLGFAIVILLIKSGPVREHHLLDHTDVRLMFASLVMMCVWVLGTRVVFAMPLALRANWIFRITQVRGTREYLAAIRRPLFLLGVAPVWFVCAVLFFSIWPWPAAAGHMAVLGLVGMTLAYLSLHGFQKIPFSCSYLPGKARLHVVIGVWMGLLSLLGKGVGLERRALDDPALYVRMVAVLVIALAAARWRTVSADNSDEAIVQFEDVLPAAIQVLGLSRDGVWPRQAASGGGPTTFLGSAAPAAGAERGTASP